MAVLLAAVCSLLAWLAVRHVRLILAIRSLNGQLGELELNTLSLHDALPI